MVSATVRFHDKEEGQELDRVQGELIFADGETLNPPDVELKTLWTVQLTRKVGAAASYSGAASGSVSSPGIQGNSAVLGIGSPGETGSSTAYFDIVGA